MGKIRQGKGRIGTDRMLTGILIMLVSAGMLVGCGSSAGSGSASSSNQSSDTVGSMAEADMVMAGESEPLTMTTYDSTENSDSGVKESGNIAANRKLIKNVTMDVETEEYDMLLVTVENRITEIGGYIENLNSSVNGGGSFPESRYAEVKARIPVEKLASFVSLVDEVSNVTSRNEYVDDITMQYVDLESHKKMLRTEQESLLRLLEKADTIEDIIAIESRLSEVRYELESMETQLRTYDNLIAYSTVQIYISEVERIAPVAEKGTWDRIKTGFGENVYRVGKGLKEFTIGLVIGLPFIFILALLALIVFIIVKVILIITAKQQARASLKQKPEIPYGEWQKEQQNSNSTQQKQEIMEGSDERKL